MNDTTKPIGKLRQRREFQRVRGRYAGYTRARFAQFARRLKRAIYPDRENVARLELSGPTERISLKDAQALSFRVVQPGEPLGPLWSTYWARVTATIPAHWKDSRVDLYWDSRSEALLWLDGRSRQGLNPGRNFATLTPHATGGETLVFFIEIACNRAFGNAEAGHPPSEPYQLVACELRRFDPDAWSLFHDFDVLRQLEADREPSQTPLSTGGVAPKIVRPALDTTWAGRLLHDLNEVCNLIDPEDKSTWGDGQALLKSLLAVGNGDVVHELSAIGHAHIDTAWLWPIEETRRKCQRSFASVVALMDSYPHFKFACSQAYQYCAIAETDPDLFARIRAKAASGQWLPIGGSWVEPDCNLPSGESISRQFLYGQRYFERTFGKRSRIFWNPDVFGYAGQLPQLMRQAGMDRFLTQKLSWNRFTSPPHHSFLWRGIDGSEVLTHFPPADTYNGMASMTELRYHAANYKDADRTSEALYLFGYGDGGGGPDAMMIEALARTSDLLGVPRSTIRTPDDFFDRLGRDAENFAGIEGELYFEYHRGTYTSQAEIKRLNRALEGALQTLEFLATASLLAGKPAPTRDEVERLWRTLLTNQFHDILPGSSIAEVYVRTRRELSETLDRVEALSQQLADALSSRASSTPINATGHQRAEVATTPSGELAFVVAAPFSAGTVGAPNDKVTLHENADGSIVLENRALRATLSAGGSLLSLLHRDSGREALAAPANRFLLFDDRPTEYEAWDIDPFALETGREAETSERDSVTERGPLRCAVRFARPIGKHSRLVQTIRLDAGAKHIEFDTQIDWHERRTLLKVAFPLNCKSPRATYETMFGAVERPTHANTDADLAQFEVPGHRWADLSEPGFGVSLLNDSRYGHAVFGNVMTLSLLRGTMSPDATADIGAHRLRYALYPHAGDWRGGQTVREAHCFNRPFIWATASDILRRPLARIEPANLIVDTLKPAEDGQGFVVRLYESTGSASKARLVFGIPVRNVHLSNTLEDRLAALGSENNACEFDVGAFQIVTLRVD
ncbi:MAG TPA: glycoside hydrolase family 38 C-terminal domain-containing protein [Rhizomicrobium sp.]|nr:glycoside hydrolase family 38 C-terminal domain-containing protein [Rhizomicrobium sp.]